MSNRLATVGKALRPTLRPNTISDNRRHEKKLPSEHCKSVTVKRKTHARFCTGTKGRAPQNRIRGKKNYVSQPLALMNYFNLLLFSASSLYDRYFIGTEEIQTAMMIHQYFAVGARLLQCVKCCVSGCDLP